MRTPTTWLLPALLLSLSCGSSEENPFHNKFFTPDPYGAYVYERLPDIDGPRLVDFGTLPQGEPRTETVVYQNRGQAPLTIHAWSISDGFTVSFPALGSEGVPIILQPGEQLLARITAKSDEPLRGRLVLESDDPDEPSYATRLIANADGSCLEQIIAHRSRATWQRHEGKGPICWNTDYGSHGAPEAYQHATIPKEGDAAWVEEEASEISFDATSSLCGKNFGEPDLCACRRGGDFTYFQTFFTISRDADVKNLTVSIRNVDDGSRVTIFNSLFPEGISPPGAFAFLGGGTTSDLGELLAPGINRVVITHLDDCCRLRVIEGATVTLDGTTLSRCED